MNMLTGGYGRFSFGPESKAAQDFLQELVQIWKTQELTLCIHTLYITF
jgi:hypothetical protein